MEHLDDQSLDKLAEGRLAPDELCRVQGHLAVCSSCRRRFEAWQAVMEGLDTLGDARESGVLNRMRQYRIRKGIRRHDRSSGQDDGVSMVVRGRPLVYGAVVAGLLMGICLAHLSTPLLEAVEGNGSTAAWQLAMDDVNLLIYGGDQ